MGWRGIKWRANLPAAFLRALCERGIDRVGHAALACAGIAEAFARPGAKKT
jgi:hypothetical protein